MKKAFASLTLTGLLMATGAVASAQQQEREQPQQQQQQRQQPSEGQAGGDVFSRLDTNRDGKLSLSEFSRAHAGASEQDAKAQFAEVDSNGDGSISKQEFTAKYGGGQ